jgi:phage FluMu gp28-like protein
LSSAVPVIQPGSDRLGKREITRARRGLFLPYQERWLDDNSPVKLWEKSRRIGADYVESYRCVVTRLLGENTRDYWYSSADESAAVEQMEYMKSWLKMFNAVFTEQHGEEMIDGDSVKVMSLRLPMIAGRAARITVMTSSPKRFRSKGGDVCLSELAFHQRPDEMWKAATPTTTWGGDLAALSSHNGETSKFNTLIGQARRRTDPATHGPAREGDLIASVHRTTIDDAIADGLVEKINETQGTAFSRAEFRANLRSKCASEDAWLEEYMCVPSAQSASFFPTVLLRDCVSKHAARPTDDLGAFLAGIEARCEKPADGKPLALGAERLAVGCDVGRKQDRFVIWVTGRVGTQRVTLGVLVYQGRNFAEMETAINALMCRIFVQQRVRRLAIDATGLGMQIAERSVGAFRTRCEAVTMTAAVKEDMFTRARAAFEERTFGLPDDDRVLADWTMIRREVTVAGNSRYSAEANEHGHADMATAGALALVADESAASPMRAVEVLGGVL